MLAGVLFRNGFEIRRAALVPHTIVESKSRFSKHANAWLFQLKDEIWSAPGVVDVTEHLIQAAFKS
jgi:hypothetical protein